MAGIVKLELASMGEGAVIPLREGVFARPAPFLPLWRGAVSRKLRFRSFSLMSYAKSHS